MTITDVIPISTILRWQQKEDVDNNNNSSDSSCKNERSNQHQNNEEPSIRFRVDTNLNTRIALWNGPLWCLQCDAIVNSSSESLRDTSGLCGKIMDAAGSQIWTECASSAPCRTGEAVVTRGCELPAKKIIHTVGPRYNIKYHNAAEHALHMCYRSSLCAAIEEKLGTVAFPCVYTKRKSYPRDEAAHIAIRTVRRFLEHYPRALDLVVFCVDSMEDQWKYEAILPLYFPRTNEEAEQSAKLLASRDVGDAYGEPLIADRQIRIHSIGRHELQSSRTSYFDGNQLEHLTQEKEKANGNEKEKEKEDSEKDEQEEEEEEGDAHVRFCEMSIDPDIERLERLRALQLERQRAATKAQQLHKQTLHYDSVLAQAKTHDWSDLTALRFLYHGGIDHADSPVIIYNANQLSLRTSEELERVLLYVIQFMDSIVEQQYSVLYLPSTSSLIEETQVNATFLKQLFQTLSTKYQQNLKFFYIFQPSMWFKLVVMVAKGFVSTVFYKKIVYLISSTQVLNIATTLDVPDYVLPSVENRNSYK